MSRAHFLIYFSDILTVGSAANHVGLSAEIWAFFSHQIRSCHAFDSWRADGRNGDVLSSFSLTHYRVFKVCCLYGVPIGCIECKLLPIGFIECKLLPIGCIECKLLPIGCIECKLLPIGCIECKLLPIGCVECKLLPIGCIECKLLPIGCVECKLLPIGCVECKLLPQSDLNLIQGMSDICRNTQTYFVLFILRAAGEHFYLAAFSWQWQHFPNYFVVFSCLPNTTFVSARFYGRCCVCFYIIALLLSRHTWLSEQK
jgi:hypothetical protein